MVHTQLPLSNSNCYQPQLSGSRPQNMSILALLYLLDNLGEATSQLWVLVSLFVIRALYYCLPC